MAAGYFGNLQFISFQVALSVGHLASLYNYDMEQYDKVNMDLLSFFLRMGGLSLVNKVLWIHIPYTEQNSHIAFAAQTFFFATGELA